MEKMYVDRIGPCIKLVEQGQLVCAKVSKSYISDLEARLQVVTTRGAVTVKLDPWTQSPRAVSGTFGQVMSVPVAACAFGLYT